MPELSPCSFRTPTWMEGISYCRHTAVHTTDHLVDHAICSACQWSQIPCETPRPVPLRFGQLRESLLTHRRVANRRNLNRSFDDGNKLHQKVTVGITAFRRPQSLQQLVQSIRWFYPHVPIVIADNGDEPAEISDVTYLKLPFDCGLSAARNALIDNLNTPFLVVLEDDFYFTEETKLEAFLDVLESDSTVGAVGGSLWQNGILLDFATDLDVFRGRLTAQRANRPWRVTHGGTRYQYADMVFNFLMLRREMLSEHRWDPGLKLVEHKDYFLNVKQAARWRIAFCPSVRCEHRQKRSESYRPYRHGARNRRYFRQFKEKHHLNSANVPATNLFTQIPSRNNNLIVFGVGHSGTSIVTRMLLTLGWHGEGRPGDLDDEYSEHIPIRKINSRLIRTRRWLQHAACNELLNLTEPWVIKDPRFVHTLDRWESVFAAWEPCLIWLVRDLESVKDSYRRRQRDPTKEPTSRGSSIEGLFQQADLLYQNWPWAKCRIEYESIREAVELYDPQRSPPTNPIRHV